MSLLQLSHLFNKDSIAHISIVGFEKSLVFVLIFGEPIELEDLLSDFFSIDVFKDFPYLIFGDIKLRQIAWLICLSTPPLSLNLPDFFIQNIPELCKDLLDNLQIDLLGKSWTEL